MKKMTKILSLVLALAMVLGMTAMAEPSKLLLQDDISNVADLQAFKDSRTNVSFLITDNFDATIGAARDNTELGLTAGNLNYNSFYNNGGVAINTINGKTFFRDSQGSAYKNGAAARAGWALALDEPWDMDENEGKILVFSADANLLAKNAGTYASWSNVVGYADLKTADATNESEYYPGYAIDEENNLVLTDGLIPQLAGFAVANSDSGTAFDATSNKSFDVLSFSNSGVIQNRNSSTGENRKPIVGKDFKLHVLFAPFRNYYSGEGFDQTFLKAITLQDYFFMYGLTSSAKAQNVKGVGLFSSSYFDPNYSNLKFYEISNSASDFYIDSVKTTTENIELDESLKVVFSQPVSSGVSMEKASGGTQGAWLDNDIVVKAGETTLVKGTDYTVEIREEIDGTAVVGVVEIIPVGEWNYGTDYTVTFPQNTANIARINMLSDAEHDVVFTTIAAPSFNIAINAYEGLAAGTAITAGAMAGKTVYFTANATNTTGRAVAGDIAIAIYDANGDIVKVAYANKAFADAGANSFSAAFKMEAGYTAKAFVKGTASEIIFR